MACYKILLACLSVSLVAAQVDRTTSTTPVPILRQVETQNPDGSYTYGYESGDGSYRIETRYATGEVKGKYGYYDDIGVLREVTYGASPTGGFEPVGNGLDLPAQPSQPAEVVTSKVEQGRRINVIRRKRPQQSSNSIPEAPRSRTVDPRTLLPELRRKKAPKTNFQPSTSRVAPAPEEVRPRPRPVTETTTTTSAPRFVPQPQFQPQINSDRFDGHPAQNIDLNSGSYTIFYSGR